MTLLRIDSATYAGTTFTASKRHIFAEHYVKQASAARNFIANTSLSLESSVGTIPPPAVLTMYRAQVEPHLVYGCEVALDVSDSELKPLLAVQHTYLPRALGLGSHSQLTPLFTETAGIWPLRHRRAALVLRYLRYVLHDEPALALAAVREAWTLAQQGHSTWWSDLCRSLITLPEPVAIELDVRPTMDMVAGLLKALERSLAQHLYKSIHDSRRLPLLWARFRSLPPTPTLSQVCAQQPYLKLTHTKPREALFRLLTVRRLARPCVISRCGQPCHESDAQTRRATELDDPLIATALLQSATSPCLVRLRSLASVDERPHSQS